VLRTLAGKLGEVIEILRAGRNATDEWTLATGHAIHRQLSALARARATAHVNVRVAPRRFGLRAAADAEVERTARIDLLANAVLSLIRAATLRGDGRQAPPGELLESIASFAEGLSDLAAAERPWPPALLADVQRRADETIAQVSARGVDPDQVVASILRAVARDLVAVIELPALTE
jgi:hypothetical protein